MEVTLLDKPSVRERFGNPGNSTLYDWAKRELLTPPVKRGPRASGWPKSEIDAITSARVSGATDDEVRRLVRRLIAERGVFSNRANSMMPVPDIKRVPA